MHIFLHKVFPGIFQVIISNGMESKIFVKTIWFPEFCWGAHGRRGFENT